MLMPNQVDFRGEKITRDRKRHYMLIKKKCTENRNEVNI